MAKSWVIVADSARVKIFEADSRTRELNEIAALIHTEGRLKDGDLVSDRGGRSFDSVGGGRHDMAKHQSPHEHEAELFARRVSERLSRGLQDGEFKRLQLAAPPAFLGLLRKHLDKNVQDVLEKVLDKNLTHEKEDALAVQFFGASKR